MAETMFGLRKAVLRQFAILSVVIPLEWSSSIILSMREVHDGMVARSWLKRSERPIWLITHLSLSSSIMVRSKSKTTITIFATCHQYCIEWTMKVNWITTSFNYIIWVKYVLVGLNIITFVLIPLNFIFNLSFVKKINK